MIVDIPNREAIVDLEHTKFSVMNEVQWAISNALSYSKGRRVQAQARLRRLNAYLGLIQDTQILPKSTLFVPGKPTLYQVHALAGTKPEAKPGSEITSAKAFRYSLEALFVCMLGAWSIGLALHSDYWGSFAVFVITVICVVSAAWHNLDDFMPLIDKKRIANVDTSAITAYELDGDLTVELQAGLGAVLWQRLVDGLRAGDPEIESAFERYCKGMTWYNERRSALDKICEVDPSEANKQLHCEAIAEARVFAKAAVVKIISMFEQRDDEASHIKTATETAARQLESEELQNQLLESARIRGVIETELKYNKPVF